MADQMGYQRPRPVGGWWLYHVTWHRWQRLHNWLYWRSEEPMTGPGADLRPTRHTRCGAGEEHHDDHD